MKVNLTDDAHLGQAGQHNDRQGNAAEQHHVVADPRKQIGCACGARAMMRPQRSDPLI
jgi:hypothetical protein